jgi:23S rRNA (pseudouridine1915-N3)-methyltransferase
MRLRITAVGRLKSGPEREILERYVERATLSGRSAHLSPLEIMETSESPARRPQDRVQEEWAGLQKPMITGARRVVLDSRGKSLSSEEFAAKLKNFRDAGADAAVFQIGGADGLPDDARKGADLVLAFGTATFPHQFVRILLAEQIYRAITILTGHPYHRA